VGDTAMIEMLLQRGVDHSDGSALWLAAHAGHMDAFRLLIDRGCDPRIGHALGNAVIARDVDAARLLTDHGAVPTSEHVAMALGHGI
jgi:ankyrin repeat protein